MKRENTTNKAVQPMTLTEVADFLRVDRVTVWRYVNIHGLPCKRKKGIRTTYLQHEVEEWLINFNKD